MEIIKAKAKDAKDIQKIIKELTIPANSKKDTGFVDYNIPKIGTISNRIKNSNFCYVVLDRKKVIGFNMAYEQKALRKLDKDRDPIIIYFSKETEKDFIYWDLLGVAKHKQDQDLGSELTKQLISDAKAEGYKAIYAVIVEKPHYNPASTSLLTKEGFSRKKALKVRDLTFGIYKLKL
ncbi:MAG: GNAT family N-acetyltransferase [Candidatus ainarchaeum sp.]|nr:GNAT family N-acetyltransferase [Candidatus ainarchaeum sp.]